MQDAIEGLALEGARAVLREPETAPELRKAVPAETAGRAVLAMEAIKHVRLNDTRRFRDFQALVAAVYAELVTR